MDRSHSRRLARMVCHMAYSLYRGLVHRALITVPQRWPHGSGPGPLDSWVSRTYVTNVSSHRNVYITFSIHRRHYGNAFTGSGFCPHTLTGYIRDAKKHDAARLAGSASPTRRAATCVSSSSSSSNAFSLPDCQTANRDQPRDASRRPPCTKENGTCRRVG